MKTGLHTQAGNAPGEEEAGDVPPEAGPLPAPAAPEAGLLPAEPAPDVGLVPDAGLAAPEAGLLPAVVPPLGVPDPPEAEPGAPRVSAVFAVP